MAGTTAPRFAGEDVTIGGAVYTVPSIPVGRLVRLKKKIDALTGADEATMIEIGLDLIHAAVSRNYPAVTREDVDVMVDPSEFKPAFDTVMRLSGLIQHAPTPDGPEGNGMAAASTPSTGTPSTPDSAPSSGGPGSTSTSS